MLIVASETQYAIKVSGEINIKRCTGLRSCRLINDLIANHPKLHFNLHYSHLELTFIFFLQDMVDTEVVMTTVEDMAEEAAEVMIMEGISVFRVQQG